MGILLYSTVGAFLSIQLWFEWPWVCCRVGVGTWDEVDSIYDG